jgi:perosamine synthetase
VNRTLSYGRHFLDEDDINAVTDVLRHGWLTQGPKIAELEAAIAQYVGAEYAVAVSSGTAALHIAAMAAGLGKGDKVVTSPNTFVASANCALYVGATPEFADIDTVTLNLDPVKLQQRCDELGTVKAIIPVHFAGLPCDMAGIRKIANAANAVVIEDAAHALGATYADGQRVGCCAYSDMTMFSFHPVKMIAMGEGGMITTNDKALYRDLLRLRSHGINKEDDPYMHPSDAYTGALFNPWYYEMQEIGFNYRITDIQCALGLSQYSKMDRFMARRRELALRYDRILKSVPHVSPTQLAGRASSAHHLYVTHIDFAAAGTTRAAFMHSLRQNNIIAQVHYIPAHMHPYYRQNGHADASYPRAEHHYRHALSLPLYYGLTDEDQDYVIQQIRNLVG